MNNSDASILIITTNKLFWLYTVLLLFITIFGVVYFGYY